jgi:AcrR family transcriptional regulator
MSSGNPETRKRILEATWRLMEKKHGQGVWIEDIAKAAKVSRQAIYLHFGSRADLLIATVRHVDEVMGVDGRLKKVNASNVGTEIVDALVEFWGKYLPEIYGLAKALLAVYDTDKDAAAAWDDRMAALQEGCRKTVECLKREGSLASGWEPDEAANLMWAMLAVEVWENLTMRRGWSNNQYIRRMQTVMKRTFVKTTKKTRIINPRHI